MAVEKLFQWIDHPFKPPALYETPIVSLYGTGTNNQEDNLSKQQQKHTLKNATFLAVILKPLLVSFQASHKILFSHQEN